MNAERLKQLRMLADEPDRLVTNGILREAMDEIERLQKIFSGLGECDDCKHRDSIPDLPPCQTCRYGELNNWELVDDPR